MEVIHRLRRWNIVFLAHVIMTFLLIQDSEQGFHEEKLIYDIFHKRNYSNLARPVENDTAGLDVKFGLSLQQIVDVDEKNEMLHTNIWLNYEWNDYKLQWNESEYGGVKSIRIPSNMIWTPDILMYNRALISTEALRDGADEDIDSKYPTNIVVYSSGLCSWVPPGLYISTCSMNIKWFPFDDQICTMKFGSWTYDGTKINLTLLWEEIDTSTYVASGEWSLIEYSAKKNIFNYPCCPEPYMDITFKIHIRRRTMYYGFNLIIPCALISSLALLTFTLPPDAGEKISLGITILLSLSVFSLIVADSVPSTSLAVPLLGITILLSLTVFSLTVNQFMPTTSTAISLLGVYFACIMFMCTISVFTTVIVLNFHHRNTDTHEMPNWVRTVICEWLAWFLRMSRPGRDLSREFLLRKARMRELESRNPPSLSLISNVKDVDNAIPLNSEYRNSEYQRAPEFRSEYANSNHRGNYISKSFDDNFSNVKGELLSILNELRFITHKMKEDDEKAEETNDWKFAAMVIDRICFWIFTVYLVVTTVAIFCSAPHLFTGEEGL